MLCLCVEFGSADLVDSEFIPLTDDVACQGLACRCFVIGVGDVCD